MIINKSNAIMMYNKIDETKEISKLSFDETKFVRYCHTINKIASLKPRIQMLGDYNLSQYLILPTMSDLVIPRRISFEIGEEFEDYRADSYSEYKPEKHGFESDIECLDAMDFNAVTKGIAGSRKKSMEGTSMVPFSEPVTITTVLKRLAKLNKGLSNSFVAPQVEYFVPIDSKITSRTEDFETQKAEVCFKMWLQDALNKISSANNSSDN